LSFSLTKTPKANEKTDAVQYLHDTASDAVQNLNIDADAVQNINIMGIQNLNTETDAVKYLKKISIIVILFLNDLHSMAQGIQGILC
jgi:hypothetical protein